MNFDFILLIIVFSHLRKTLKSKILLPKIDKYLLFGIFVSIGLLVLSTIIDKKYSFYLFLVAHFALFTFLYLSFTKPILKPVKPFVYSILPFVILNFLNDFVDFIHPKFHAEWENYFETAILFSVIWFFAMYFINKKQRKDIEREQLKAIEREREFQQSEALKAKLEIQVAERTAELVKQKNELLETLEELKTTQNQLIQSEKMASLGELTAGIAHEIQNPLNFVNNFSEVSNEMIQEIKEERKKNKENRDEALENELLDDISSNLEKIIHHGKRADGIVKGMLQHSRSSSGSKEPTDINKLTDEYLKLAYHGLRAKDKSFNATMITDYDESITEVPVIPQDMGRAILNLITNAFYATNEKQKSNPENLPGGQAGYVPTLTVSTKKLEATIEITVKDNANGIPQSILDKIFQPFFTTKPTGKGTGLGLSLTYDIVKAHGGELKVETKEGEGSTFFIILDL